jgi:ribosomal protein S27AE
MNNSQFVSTEHMDTLQSPYTCIRCGEGSMISAVQEGEPDYTDNYLCSRCHYHDNIPTSGILLSQLMTSLLGLGLSLYLLYEYILSNNDKSVTQVETTALALVVSGFVIGFVYVLYKAAIGYNLRKSYLKN